MIINRNANENEERIESGRDWTFYASRGAILTAGVLGYAEARRHYEGSAGKVFNKSIYLNSNVVNPATQFANMSPFQPMDSVNGVLLHNIFGTEAVRNAGRSNTYVKPLGGFDAYRGQLNQGVFGRGQSTYDRMKEVERLARSQGLSLSYKGYFNEQTKGLTRLDLTVKRQGGGSFTLPFDVVQSDGSIIGRSGTKSYAMGFGSVADQGLNNVKFDILSLTEQQASSYLKNFDDYLSGRRNPLEDRGLLKTAAINMGDKVGYSDRVGIRANKNIVQKTLASFKLNPLEPLNSTSMKQLQINAARSGFVGGNAGDMAKGIFTERVGDHWITNVPGADESPTYSQRYRHTKNTHYHNNYTKSVMDWGSDPNSVMRNVFFFNDDKSLKNFQRIASTHYGVNVADLAAEEGVINAARAGWSTDTSRSLRFSLENGVGTGAKNIIDQIISNIESRGGNVSRDELLNILRKYGSASGTGDDMLTGALHDTFLDISETESLGKAERRLEKAKQRYRRQLAKKRSYVNSFGSKREFELLKDARKEQRLLKKIDKAKQHLIDSHARFGDVQNSHRLLEMGVNADGDAVRLKSDLHGSFINDISVSDGEMTINFGRSTRHGIATKFHSGNSAGKIQIKAETNLMGRILAHTDLESNGKLPNLQGEALNKFLDTHANKMGYNLVDIVKGEEAVKAAWEGRDVPVMFRSLIENVFRGDGHVYNRIQKELNSFGVTKASIAKGIGNKDITTVLNKLHKIAAEEGTSLYDLTTKSYSGIGRSAFIELATDTDVADSGFGGLGSYSRNTANTLRRSGLNSILAEIEGSRVDAMAPRFAARTMIKANKAVVNRKIAGIQLTQDLYENLFPAKSILESTGQNIVARRHTVLKSNQPFNKISLGRKIKGIDSVIVFSDNAMLPYIGIKQGTGNSGVYKDLDQAARDVMRAVLKNKTDEEIAPLLGKYTKVMENTLTTVGKGWDKGKINKSMYASQFSGLKGQKEYAKRLGKNLGYTQDLNKAPVTAMHYADIERIYGKGVADRAMNISKETGITDVWGFVSKEPNVSAFTQNPVNIVAAEALDESVTYQKGFVYHLSDGRPVLTNKTDFDRDPLHIRVLLGEESSNEAKAFLGMNMGKKYEDIHKKGQYFREVADRFEQVQLKAAKKESIFDLPDRHLRREKLARMKLLEKTEIGPQSNRLNAIREGVADMLLGYGDSADDAAKKLYMSEGVLHIIEESLLKAKHQSHGAIMEDEVFRVVDLLRGENEATELSKEQRISEASDFLYEKILGAKSENTMNAVREAVEARQYSELAEARTDKWHAAQVALADELVAEHMATAPNSSATAIRQKAMQEASILLDEAQFASKANLELMTEGAEVGIKAKDRFFDFVEVAEEVAQGDIARKVSIEGMKETTSRIAESVKAGAKKGGLIAAAALIPIGLLASTILEPQSIDSYSPTKAAHEKTKGGRDTIKLYNKGAKAPAGSRHNISISGLGNDESDIWNKSWENINQQVKEESWMTSFFVQDHPSMGDSYSLSQHVEDSRNKLY